MQSLTDQFKAFVKSRPRDEEYDFMSTSECACGQFAQTLGWRKGDGDTNLRYPIELKFGHFAGQYPRTFGALSDRLEKLSS